MELTPRLLLTAYTQGMFPMAQEDGVYWYQPDPRTILPLDAFHISRSLQRVMKKRPYQIHVDTAFEAVMRYCAAPAPGREETWISEDLIMAYTRLHQLGLAHSVEAWRDGKLVGGLYGVALGGFFAGESMFSRETNASKIALVHLVQHLNMRRFQLLDVQFMTNHLQRFGAVEISDAEYQQKLHHALLVDTTF
ncbi:MAG: leucyl/phenylalanyl-tRNA--protein transferase [Ardenticatenaceae bacterium]|nr:leucyl/phenylalanyl-tRNA--protein transferase [Anaerolineales bacterium]MCB8920482.1 leucyl/phenylalanyl-tRNA--protein transferase [Ardenticatenaceae bacterium]MCB8989436.1 leucyl/phenylalanyl-tRNA--protein transferase [Ardenticatenaceae bacterium]MCB9005026.1 leucyl/phenylalanyl-tRNA--protein transferase [Ardenticatenaceae bacterium]